LVSRISVGLVDKDLDEIFWWIEENVPREYERPEEIAQAFDALSRADLFRQRVRLRQNWRLRKYMIDLMTGGVSLAKKGVYSKFVKYAYPSKLIVLGRSKLERRVERERLLQLSRLLHCSTKKIRSEFLPFLGFLRDFVHEG
jgi:replication factor C large subunit